MQSLFPLIHKKRQTGVSLIIVLLILVIISLLGVAAIQISKMATQSARNQRDTQIAWQSAEAALLDAELDILGQPTASTNNRGNIFINSNTQIQEFVSGCGTSGKNLGLCLPSNSPTPVWVEVDFLASSSPRYVSFGDITGRSFQSGSAGTQPAHPPRYIIELLDDPNVDRTKSAEYRKYIYRITAVGFGPNENTQVVLQTIYRN